MTLGTRRFERLGCEGANVILSRARRRNFQAQPGDLVGQGVAGRRSRDDSKKATRANATRRETVTRMSFSSRVGIETTSRVPGRRPRRREPTPELPPSAIGLPPSRPSVAAGRSDARGSSAAARRRSATPGPRGVDRWRRGRGRRERRRFRRRRVAVSDAAAAGANLLRRTDSASVVRSKIFVVAYSRRSADYVTYSCRLPKGRSVA